jgi:ATP sulfurylase/adenylyl-sulfate kinase
VQGAAVIWLTGLSGAGKSTIADALKTRLELHGHQVQILDGDLVRAGLCAGLGFSREDRDENIRRIAVVADLLSRNGVTVIVAAISPYREARDLARAQIGRFVEVLVDCTIAELVRRDVKGLYAKALAGEIKAFTGISDPYEPPLAPEIRVDTGTQTVDESVEFILAFLRSHGHVSWTPQRAPGIKPHGGTLQVRAVPADCVPEFEREARALPEIELETWSRTDLELLSGGALSPLTGFMGEADLVSVRDTMRLASGLPWSLPITLPVDAGTAAQVSGGDRIALSVNGHPAAILTVTEAFRYDRTLLAARVYGTSDVAHPGVARTLSQPEWALGGPVEVIHRPPSQFMDMCMTPLQTREEFLRRGWRTIVGFQTRNPVHRAHEYLLRVALEQCDGLLLHPLVGETKGDDIPAHERIRCYEALVGNHLPAFRVLLSVFPASMRYAGPREAIFHAIVRQNYGCTHFIVGRDHAGVGSYYDSYAAQKVFDAFTPGEIGIQIMKFENSFYCHACQGMATTKTCAHQDSDRLLLSGTRVREMLRVGEALPVEFTRPEIAAILSADGGTGHNLNTVR